MLVHAGQVLMAKRGKPPRKGSWSIPGGAQELGETIEQAVRRELLEETGLLAGQLHFLTTIDLIERDGDGNIRHHYTLIDFAARRQGGELCPGDDAMEVKWFGANELDQVNLWSETRRIIEMAQALEL